MSDDADRIILKEYLSTVLTEGPTDTWMDAFIDPFLDIGRSALYAIEKTGGEFKSLVRKSLARAAVVFVPFLKMEWDRFQQEEKSKLEAIDKKYGGVIGRNMAAMQHQDLSFLGFLINPQVMLAQKILPGSIETALEMSLAFLPNWGPLRAILDRYRQLITMGPTSVQPAKSGANHYDMGGGGGGGGYGYDDFGGGGDYGVREGRQSLAALLTEAPDPRAMAQFGVEVRALLTSNEFKQALGQSPLVFEMNRTVVMDAVKAVSDFMRLDSPEKVKGRVGSAWAKAEKDLGPVLQDPKAGASARQALDQAMVAAAQTQYKQMFAQKLTEMSSANPSMAKLYQWGIAEINKAS